MVHLIPHLGAPPGGVAGIRGPCCHGDDHDLHGGTDWRRAPWRQVGQAAHMRGWNGCALRGAPGNHVRHVTGRGLLLRNSPWVGVGRPGTTDGRDTGRLFWAAVAGDDHGVVFRHSHLGDHVRPGVCGVDGGPEGRLSAGFRGAGQHDRNGVSVLPGCEETATAHAKAGGDAETSPGAAGAAIRTTGNAPNPGARLASKAGPPPARWLAT